MTAGSTDVIETLRDDPDNSVRRRRRLLAAQAAASAGGLVSLTAVLLGTPALVSQTHAIRSHHPTSVASAATAVSSAMTGRAES